MANKRLKVGDVVRWKELYRGRWSSYPGPLVVTRADLRPVPGFGRNDYVIVRDANGITRSFSEEMPFGPDWFELDPFLTAVHQRRNHGK